MSIDTPCEVLGLKELHTDIFVFLTIIKMFLLLFYKMKHSLTLTYMSVTFIQEIAEGATVPFIVVRMRAEACGEKFLLKTGEGVSWEVGNC